MIKNSEIIAYAFLIILCFISSIFLFFTTKSYFLFLIPIIVFIIVFNLLKKNKKTLEFVKKDFEKLGYELVSERPLKSSESEIDIKPAILINGVPLKNHKNQYKRMFTAKSTKGKMVELNVVITEKKNGKIAIEIKNEKQIHTYQ